MDVYASYGLTGRQAEAALVDAGVVTNRNSIPRDPNGAWYTSGIRLGTPALTTLGLGTDEFDEIADIITTVLRATRRGHHGDGNLESPLPPAAGHRRVLPPTLRRHPSTTPLVPDGAAHRVAETHPIRSTRARGKCLGTAADLGWIGEGLNRPRLPLTSTSQWSG